MNNRNKMIIELIFVGIFAFIAGNTMASLIVEITLWNIITVVISHGFLIWNLYNSFKATDRYFKERMLR